MTRQAISEDIRRFILTSIPSVPFLEAMLLLRNEPEQPWDAKRLARRLYLSEINSSELLTHLHAAGFLALVDSEHSHYRYQPNSTELADMVGQVADTYSKHIVDVTNLIHSNVSKQAQQFADAFKWRKDT